MTGSLFFFFKLNVTFEKLQEKKYELPSNEQMISYLYELKLSIWKLASPQDENPLKTEKTGKNILPEFPVINQVPQCAPTYSRPQHFPSCICFTQTMNLMQDYVIINMQIHSK